MDGFKDSTKVQYMKGGKVGTKGAAKIAKVMGEFKRGELHSGSKKGPEVTSRKQAVAIAMSEAGKKPVKKAGGGPIMEGVSTRPVDGKGRRMPMQMVPMDVKNLPKRAKGAGAVDAALAAAKTANALGKNYLKMGGLDVGAAVKDAIARGASRKGATDPAAARAAAMQKVEAVRKGVPTFGNKPMLERAKGGLACMPKRGK